MLAVVDEARVLAGEAHAAWSESFNEMFAQAAGAFANAAVRRHGRERPAPGCATSVPEAADHEGQSRALRRHPHAL